MGTMLMMIAAIYPVFRRIAAFRWLASNTMWFDFHLMAGTVGPMFIGLHSVLRLDSWVSTAFWSMVITVVSGFLGRYLYTQVPESRAASSSRSSITSARSRRPDRCSPSPWPRSIASSRSSARPRNELHSHRACFGRCGGWCFQDIGRIPRTMARKSWLRQLGVDRAARNDLARRAARMIVIARRQVVAPKAALLLHSWKKVHVPFTILMTGFSAVHTWISWSRAGW